jgi:hypothetical protein
MPHTANLDRLIARAAGEQRLVPVGQSASRTLAPLTGPYRSGEIR